MYNKNRETLEAYVLGDDFKYFQNLKYLPLSVYPSNIQSALVVYCFSGKAKLNVYDDYSLKEWNDAAKYVSNQNKEFNNSLDAKKYICSILMHKE